MQFLAEPVLPFGWPAPAFRLQPYRLGSPPLHPRHRRRLPGTDTASSPSSLGPPCRRKSARTMLFSVVSARRKATHQRASKHPAIQRAVREGCFIPAPPVPRSQMPGRAHPQGAHEHPAPEERRRKPNKEKGRIEPRNASNAPRPQQFKALQAMGRAKHSLSAKGKECLHQKGRKRKNPVPLRFLPIGFKKERQNKEFRVNRQLHWSGRFRFRKQILPVELARSG